MVYTIRPLLQKTTKENTDKYKFHTEGFKPAIQVFEQTKIGHVTNYAATGVI